MFGHEDELEYEIKKLTKERDNALNALTVSQEEWLLKVKNLEVENYELKQKLEKAHDLIYAAAHAGDSREARERCEECYNYITNSDNEGN